MAKSPQDIRVFAGTLLCLSYAAIAISALMVVVPAMGDRDPDLPPLPHGIYPQQALGAVLLFFAVVGVAAGTYLLNKTNNIR